MDSASVVLGIEMQAYLVREEKKYCNVAGSEKRTIVKDKTRKKMAGLL